MDKRFIEESFPIKEVSKESAREKSIRHGHISTLHIWWARRPLASSRATSYAALTQLTKDNYELNEKKNFIVNLSKWENSLNHNFIEKAKKEILSNYNNENPRVLDPFAGGGSIPLEALRLGCDVYAVDYNPVAVFIEKCTLEYPQKYGEKLIRDVEKWGKWLIDKTRDELIEFYPNDRTRIDGLVSSTIVETIPIGYIWLKEIKCPNPSCNVNIPLLRQFWLVRKPDKKVSLYPIIDEKKVNFKILGDGYEEIPEKFNPSKGTVSRAVVKCLVCGTIIKGDFVRKKFFRNQTSQRLVVIVTSSKDKKGKYYRIANKEDTKNYLKAEKYLNIKRKELIDKWNIDPIPDEEIEEKSLKQRDLFNYGLRRWGDLYNSRQKLLLITLFKNVKKVYKSLLSEGINQDYSKVIVSYLAILINRIASYNTKHAPWHVTREIATQIFGRQAFPMVWDYTEINPFSVSFSLLKHLEWILLNLKHLCYMKAKPARVIQHSATALSFEDNFFDAVFTDPPYYNNINYAELSDFFYVLLKRSIGDLYPDLFSTPLTPKSKEIVANPVRAGSSKEAKIFFESLLSQSFKEIYRVLKPGGIAVIVYAHKTTEGWETVINALLDSGLTVTASWPISTEMKVRLLAKETAALASSIYIVARKFEKKKIAIYYDVKKELTKVLNFRLNKLWSEGISGADFFIAAIGTGIEVFAKYKKVVDYEGNVIKAKSFIKDIREIVTDFAINQILKNGFSADISPLTRFYVLWRWNFGKMKAPFDEARKLAQSVGIDLENEWNKGFIKKEKNFIRVLGPQERSIDELKDSEKLIDVLHYSLLLWEQGQKEKLQKVLSLTGFGSNDVFYRVAQAISETLPVDCKEKKLLDGFLLGREQMKEKTNKFIKQKKMDEWIE